MQKITKDQVSFIIFLFISSVLIISPFSTIRIQTYESEYFPESNSLASDFVFEWNSSLGGVYVDGARGVAVDSNDNVYIAGYQDQSGSNTNHSCCSCSVFEAHFHNRGSWMKISGRFLWLASSTTLPRKTQFSKVRFATAHRSA